MAACLDRYANLVWSLARRFTSSGTEAEDAVQEIFIDLWSSADRYDSSKSSETTFIAMVARRRLIDRLRKTKREPEMKEIEEAFDLGVPGHAAATEINDEAALALKLIQTLKPEQRQIIQLSVYHGHTHQSIAEMLGLPLGTVKTHLRRGLLRIREAMQAMP
jgi:RNA polymerase sigma-70 factor (ECF subfamily)